MRGDDLRYDLTIDFVEAIFGTEKKIRIRRLEACETCKGSGSASGRGPSVCPAVPGTGSDPLSAGILLRGADMQRLQRQRIDYQRSLPDVPGRDAVDQRDRAHGQGSAGAWKRERGFATRAKATWAAETVQAAISMLCFQSAQHDFFAREGQNLHCVIPISFPQAALGAEIEIPAVDGPVMLKVPEGIQSGKELRIRGKGVPYLNERGRGDLIVKVVVQIPKKLSRAQRDLIAELAKTMSVENKPTSPGLLDKMKDLFS